MKRPLCFGLILLVLYVSCVATRACANITSVKPHIVGWWKLDDSTRVQPNVLHGANGTIFGNVKIKNGSLHFNNAYMELDSDTLKPHSRDFSVEFWFTRERRGEVEVLVDFKDQAGVGFGIFFDLEDNIVVEVGVNNSFRQVNSMFVVNDNVCHHLAVVVERDGFTKVYLDSDINILREHFVSSDDMIPNTPVFAIGAEWNGNTYERYFKGAISEFTYYFTLVSNEIISDIFAAGTLGKCSIEPPPTAPPTAAPTAAPTNFQLLCEGIQPPDAVCNGDTGEWEIRDPVAIGGTFLDIYVPVIFKGEFTVSDSNNTISLFNGATLSFELCPKINEKLTVFVDILANDSQGIITLPDNCDVDLDDINLKTKDPCQRIVKKQSLNTIWAKLSESQCTESGSSKVAGSTIAWITCVAIVAVVVTVVGVFFLAQHYTKSKRVDLKEVEKQLESDM